MTATRAPSRREFLRLAGAAGVLCLGSLLRLGRPARAARPAPLPKLRVSYAATVGSFAALWMADAIGAFEKYGVRIDMSYMEPTTAVAAMLANETDVQEASAASIIAANVNGQADMAIIASALNGPTLAMGPSHPGLGLYTVQSITTPEQLEGKSIASGKPGTPVDDAARLSLSLLGLQPSDVQLLPLDGGPEIVAAMLSGQVSAGVVAPPQSFQVAANGYHLLHDMVSRSHQNVGLVARRDRLDELAPRLGPLLAAYRDGILAWNAQPNLATQVLDKYVKVGDPEILQKSYHFYRTTAPFEPTMQPTLEGLQATMDYLSATIPAVKQRQPEQFVDTRFLAQVAA